MKCAVALLFDRTVENIVNELAWRAHMTYGVGVGVRRLPAHVSLKQPFSIGPGIDDLERVLAAIHSFSETIEPFPVSFSDLSSWQTILQYYAHPIDDLRQLHHRLHETLVKTVADPSAPFDGDAYTFHLTIAIGGSSAESFANAVEEFQGIRLPTAVPTHLGVFVYDNDYDPGGGSYLTVRALRIASLH